MDNNYSLTDLATAAGGGAGAGGGLWFLIIIVVFMLIGGGWNRGGDYGQYATAASQQEILFGQRFSALDNKIDRIGNGIADATYALNNTITGEGRSLQGQISEAKYELAGLITDRTQRIMDAQAADKIGSLQAQVSELKMQNAMGGIPRINPYAYGLMPYSPCGCNGCRCGQV